MPELHHFMKLLCCIFVPPGAAGVTLIYRISYFWAIMRSRSVVHLGQTVHHLQNLALRISGHKIAQCTRIVMANVQSSTYNCVRVTRFIVSVFFLYTFVNPFFF